MNKLYFPLLLCMFLVLISCDCKGQDSHITKPNNNPISYIALGDSYTIGHKVSPKKRWPMQFIKVLRDSGININDPKIVAKTGWTTIDLRKAIAKTDLKPSYDIVSLLIGVNDQYDELDFDDYPERFRFLLKKAIMLAGGRVDHVFVVSIPDYSVTPFGQKRNPTKISRELAEYNAMNKSITHRFKAHYINITPGSKKAATNPGLVAQDGLHPSGKMYAQWVDQIVPVMLPKIKSWTITQL